MAGLRALTCALAVYALAGAADQKHMRISTSDHVVVDLAANSIETESSASATIVHLKGSVEIRMRWADASPERMVMHADTADFHEDTGEVDAHGNVTVTPVKEAEGDKIGN
jgi:lipopolysaccharide assembly outer membrane protein LptD (OstA)